MAGDIEKLIAELESSDLDARIAAAQSLGTVQDERAVDALISALDDSNSNVRTPAAEALGNRGATKAVEPLIATLRDKQDNNAETQTAIAHALGKLGDRRAVEVLNDLLHDKLASLEKGTVDCAAQFGMQDIASIVEKAAKEQQMEARRAAAAAIEKITGKRPPVPGSGCFVATACYGTTDCDEVRRLRAFRDSVLLRSTSGKLLVSIYYRFSPPLAKWLRHRPKWRERVKECLLVPIVRCISDRCETPNKTDAGDGQ